MEFLLIGNKNILDVATIFWKRLNERIVYYNVDFKDFLLINKGLAAFEEAVKLDVIDIRQFVFLYFKRFAALYE